MDVAPWDKDWIKIELDGIGWYSMVFYLMVFDSIRYCSMVCDGIRRVSLGYVGI